MKGICWNQQIKNLFLFHFPNDRRVKDTWNKSMTRNESLLWSYENRLVVGKAWVSGRGSAPSGRRCFQLTALFAALRIVEHPNTDKFHLGCILFIQQFFSRRNICYPLLNKSLLYLFHGEGRVAPGEGHLFAAHFSNVSENYYNSQRERGKSLFVSFLQLKGVSKLEMVIKWTSGCQACHSRALDSSSSCMKHSHWKRLRM